LTLQDDGKRSIKAFRVYGPQIELAVEIGATTIKQMSQALS